MIAKVAVSTVAFSVDKPYDYLVPVSMQKNAVPGIRVFVPFGKGNRITEGIILATSESSDCENIKEILRLADEEPLLGPEQLKLTLFMRERYFCTVYEAAKTMIPAGYWFDRTGRQRSRDKFREMVCLAIPAEEAVFLAEKIKKRAPKQAEILELLSDFEILPAQDVLQFTASKREALKRLEDQQNVKLFDQEILRRPEKGSISPSALPILSADQDRVFHELKQHILYENSSVSLLSGVTGSGKTGVYAHLIKEILDKNGGAILLVPEIALTPQMLQLFSSWFGEEVAVLHSGLSSGERFDEWKRIRKGNAHLIIGTRSAVFAPVQNLKLLIIDEEQEDSYSSESNPRYHARDIARFRCHLTGANLLLGSATPDIRSRYAAETGEYAFYQLKNRYNDRPLPAVRIVDMKQELKQGNLTSLSKPLREAILQRIERQEQSILFLNRRGTNKMVTCGSCGYIYRCPHCSVSMTWHANRKRLICHYCGFNRYLDPKCPECGGELNFFGAGTQMVEEELHTAFPGVEIIRVDADTVSPIGSHRVLFDRFVQEKIPLMIGTQMIAKGLHFDNVTLVGVLSADQSLYTNDFRAGEKTFSLLTQVIGRAGRSRKAGEALVQTFTPDNEIIRMAAMQDYESFYHKELQMRQIQNAPPYYDWIGFSAVGKDENQVLWALHECRKNLERMIPQDAFVQLLGPVPMSVVRIKDRFRYRLQICCKADRNIRRVLSSLLLSCSKDKEMRNISFYIENEPEP